eukprot:3249176-Prymnesium_polylepis.1
MLHRVRRARPGAPGAPGRQRGDGPSVTAEDAWTGTWPAPLHEAPFTRLDDWLCLVGAEQSMRSRPRRAAAGAGGAVEKGTRARARGGVMWGFVKD